MSGIKWIGFKEGYEYISEKGYKYDLLEGMALGGELTSDIVFILLSFDNGLTDKVETEFVGYFFGANCFKTEEMEEIIKEYVKEYEEKMNL